MILQFFVEFHALVKNQPSLKEKFVTVLGKIEGYSSRLAPLVNLALPGAGDIASGVIGVTNAIFDRDMTLHTQREELLKALKDTGVPIVVLIDELDRIEDAEIRAAAQLVRAVADFPSISYVLAYDHDRVVQALGAGGDGDERVERGRVYLEKIVQFQISLPVTFDEELKDLLLAEMGKLVVDVALPNEWQSDERLLTLLGIMFPRPIATPRDIRRLVGTYHVIGSMLRDEVDWVDLLAFSVLMIKAPATVAKLRRNADRVVENPFSSRALYEQYSESNGDRDELKRLISEHDAASGVADLLTFLFPRLAKNELRDERHSDSLCFWRPLFTALRLGLPQGAVSRESIVTLLSSTSGGIEQALWDLYEEEKLAAFLGRFEAVYSQMRDVEHNAVWLGVSGFLKRSDSLWPHAYSPMRDAIHEFSKSAMRICETSSELQGAMPELIRLLI